MVAAVTGCHGNRTYATRLLEEGDETTSLSELGDEARRRVEALITHENVLTAAAAAPAAAARKNTEGRQQDAVAKGAETVDADVSTAADRRRSATRALSSV